MDPNQTLADIREAITDLKAASRREFAYREAADRLVYAVEELDEWMSKGGLLPKAWRS